MQNDKKKSKTWSKREKPHRCYLTYSSLHTVWVDVTWNAAKQFIREDRAQACSCKHTHTRTHIVQFIVYLRRHESGKIALGSVIASDCLFACVRERVRILVTYWGPFLV